MARLFCTVLPPACEDFCLNGARMPSMAEELETDVTTMRSRILGSRR